MQRTEISLAGAVLLDNWPFLGDVCCKFVFIVDPIIREMNIEIHPNLIDALFFTSSAKSEYESLQDRVFCSAVEGWFREAIDQYANESEF